VYGTDLVLDGRKHQYDGEEVEPEVGDRAAYVAAFREQQQEIFREVTQRTQAAHEKNQRRYDMRRRNVDYPVGAKLWRKKLAQSDASRGFAAKLAPKWLGPVTVRKKLGRWTYELEDRHCRSLGRWHADQLKTYYGRPTCEDARTQRGGEL